QVGEGESCGGFRPPPVPVCRPTLFCELPAGSCGVADIPGKCVAVSSSCDLVYAPVCGCDGKTYANDCNRREAHVQLDHSGECKQAVGQGQMCGGIAAIKCGAGLFC